MYIKQIVQTIKQIGEKTKNIMKKNNILTSTVNSTVIASLEYNTDSKILTVKLHSGSVSSFSNVSMKDYDQFRSAKSVGAHFNTIIKKNFTLIK